MSPRRYRSRRPRTAAASPIPVLWLTRGTAKRLTEMGEEWPKRVERGRELFLLEMAKFLRAQVRKRAPEIAGLDYAKSLKIATVHGVRDMDAVAVYFEDMVRKLDFDADSNTVLFFSSKTGSPRWVAVLTQYGPWPVDLLPVVPDTGEAKIVARRARTDEVNRLTSRILDARAQIESDLRRAGATGAKVVSSRQAEGLEVHDDIGYTVLRKEFGYDGPAEAHWRPALKALLEHTPRVLTKYAEFIADGKEFRFDLPDDHGELTRDQLRQGAKFQETLAPFVK